MSKLADALEGGSKGWAGAGYVRIEGATDPRDRLQAAARFRNDPTIRVALLSVTAAGAPCCQLDSQEVMHFIANSEDITESCQPANDMLPGS